MADFSPDSAWAFKNKLSINYSSAKNAVVCPKLKISSDQAKFSNPRMRNELAGFISGGNSSHAANTVKTTTGASRQAADNSVSGSAVTSAGSGQAVAKKDDGGK